VPFPAALADELAALMVGKDRDALVFADFARRGSAQLELAGAGVRTSGGRLPEG